MIRTQDDEPKLNEREEKVRKGRKRNRTKGKEKGSDDVIILRMELN